MSCAPTSSEVPARRRAQAAALLLALGLAARVALLLTYERDVDGDEAVVGLMALRIAEDGQAFLFWPGRPYNGGAALNAYLGAAAFQLFGPSSLALKAPALLWSMGTLLLTYAFARRFIGEREALAALLFAALGPVMFCRWGVKCYLGGPAALLNMAAAYAWFSALNGGGLGAAALGGACLAAGYYVSPFVLPMAAACAAWGLRSRPDFYLRRGFYAGLVGFCLGFAPALLALQSGSAAELTPRPGLGSLGQAAATAALRAAYFFGAPNRYFGAPRLAAWAWVSAAGSLAALVFAARAAWRVRGRPDAPGAAARNFALLFLAAHAAAFVLSPQDVQYLFPAYPFLAILCGQAAANVRPRALGRAWACAVAAANVAGVGVEATRPHRPGFDNYVYSNVQFRRFVASLKPLGVRHVYATSALAHLLTFESRRAVTAVSYDAVFADDVQRVSRAKRYAYVFYSHSDYDALLSRWLTRRRVRHQRRRIGEWIVRWDFSSDARPDQVKWRTDYFGPFPDRRELWKAALRLNPWNAEAQYRLIRREPARERRRP